jgi:hypothetical protein
LADAAGNSGTGLVEIYEDDATSNRLTNLSSRALVGAGADIVIAGFVVRGQKAARYLIRGVGPGLGVLGVTGTLSDPVLTLTTSAGGAVASNDDWGRSANVTEIAAAATQVGAFSLGASSKDAAMLVTLQPGSYTALMSGAGGTSGVALVEIFELP